jgi:hypothetical protein
MRLWIESMEGEDPMPATPYERVVLGWSDERADAYAAAWMEATQQRIREN